MIMLISFLYKQTRFHTSRNLKNIYWHLIQCKLNNILQTLIISAIIFHITLHTDRQRMLKLYIKLMVPFWKLWTIKQVCAVSHKINPNLTIFFSKIGDLSEKVQSFYRYKNNMKMMCQYSLGDWIPQEADFKTIYYDSLLPS